MPRRENTCIVLLICPDKELLVTHYRYDQTRTFLSHYRPRQGNIYRYVCLATDIRRKGNTCVTLPIIPDKEIYTFVWLPICLEKEIHVTLSMCTDKCMYVCLVTDMPRQGNTCVFLPICLDRVILVSH